MKIEKNIPIPTIVRIRTKKSKYPFARMAVGDSLGFKRSARMAVRSAVAQYSKRHPTHKFVTRMNTDEFRVWRTE